AFAEVHTPRRSLELFVPLGAQRGELLRGTVLRELVGARGCLGEGHTLECRCAAARIAAADRSTSSSVVRQLETEMRIACSPSQSVPPSQQVPSSCTSRITSRVRSPSPNRTST